MSKREGTAEQAHFAATPASSAKDEGSADKNRTERSFTVGELVYLKLQPHLQSFCCLQRESQAALQVLWSL